jgi:hypothetical protein
MSVEANAAASKAKANAAAANAAAKVAANAAAKAPASVPGFTAGSAIGSMAIIGCGIASIILFIRSTMATSDLIGDTENWRAIKPQIKRIWWQTAVGTVILFIGMFAYVLQFEEASVVFILLISCISLALSFASISMSAISTSGAAPTA